MIDLWPGRRLLFLGLVAASLGLATLAATVAYGVQVGVDALARGEQPSDRLMFLGAAFLSIACAGALLEVFRARTAERIGLEYVAQVRAALFERILGASPELLAQRGQGGLLLPFVGDLSAVKKWVSDGLARVISATVSSVLLLGVLATKSPLLCLAASAVFFCAATVVLALSGPLNNAVKETRARRGAVASYVSSSIRGAVTIRAFHRLGRESKRLARRNTDLMTAGLRLAGVSGAMSAAVNVAALTLVAVTLLVGSIEVYAGEMSIGVVAAALSISGLLAGAIRDLGVGFELWRRANASFGKITAALAIQPAVGPTRAKRAPKQSRDTLVTLRGIAVEGLIEDFSAELVRGDIVNVLGASGSGKSTLLSIVARLREPDRGRLRIVGTDVRDLKEKILRGMIGFAGAATPLLPGSIGMNLRYRAPKVSEHELQRVISCCNIDTIIARLPRGLDTRLGEGSPELSSSERQRVEIGRAMMGRPEVLILDGVDTHLDEESALRIGLALGQYEGAVLMAATTPTLRQFATAIWCIDNGTVRVNAGPARRLGLVRNERATELS